MAIVCCGFSANLATAQFASGYGSLPGFSENTSAKRIGDAQRLAKERKKLSGELRDQDEIWLISTRRLCQRSSSAGGSTFRQADVAQWAAGCWSNCSPTQLLETINQDSTRLNLLFIHGNRTDLQWANVRGVQTYESLISGLELPTDCLETAPPIRWIIWAWNSDPLHGPRVDLAVKKQRAIDQGPYLAEFMQGIAQPELGVFAYSLGAQVLTSSMEVRQSSVSTQETGEATSFVGPRLDVVMVAGAVPSCWFHSDQARDSLPSNVQRLTLINNPTDRALQVYQRLTGQSPIGLQRRQLDAVVSSDTFLVSGNSLDNHYLSRYMEHTETRRIVRRGLLPTDEPSVLVE